MTVYRCPADCPVCHGTRVKTFRATISVGGKPAITFTYDAECPRGRGAEMFLAARRG